MKTVVMALLVVSLFLTGVRTYADEGGGDDAIQVCIGEHCVDVPADGGE